MALTQEALRKAWLSLEHEILLMRRVVEDREHGLGVEWSLLVDQNVLEYRLSV